MTISNNYQPVTTAANGAVTVFTFPWNAITRAALFVELVNTTTNVRTPQVEGTDFVSALTDPAGGTVTFNTAPAAGNNVIISRRVAQEQDVPYGTSAGFQGDVMERSFDELTAMVQDLADGVDRSITLPVGSGGDITLPSPEANRGLKWDENGTNLINSDNDPDEVVTEAQTSATAAAASATAAANSATASAASAQQAQEAADSILAVANREKLTSSGQWTVPANVTRVRATLRGGGGGGGAARGNQNAAADGTAGGVAQISYTVPNPTQSAAANGGAGGRAGDVTLRIGAAIGGGTSSNIPNAEINAGYGGGGGGGGLAGGSVGAAGAPGGEVVVVLAVTPGDLINYSAGPAGAGGVDQIDTTSNGRPGAAPHIIMEY